MICKAIDLFYLTIKLKTGMIFCVSIMSNIKIQNIKYQFRLKYKLNI